MKITVENLSYIQLQCREEIPFEQFQVGALVADTMKKEEKKHLTDKGEIMWAQAHFFIWKDLEILCILGFHNKSS